MTTRCFLLNSMMMGIIDLLLPVHVGVCVIPYIYLTSFQDCSLLTTTTKKKKKTVQLFGTATKSKRSTKPTNKKKKNKIYGFASKHMTHIFCNVAIILVCLLKYCIVPTPPPPPYHALYFTMAPIHTPTICMQTFINSYDTWWRTTNNGNNKKQL